MSKFDCLGRFLAVVLDVFGCGVDAERVRHGLPKHQGWMNGCVAKIEEILKLWLPLRRWNVEAVFERLPQLHRTSGTRARIASPFLGCLRREGQVAQFAVESIEGNARRPLWRSAKDVALAWSPGPWRSPWYHARRPTLGGEVLLAL
jgi:hypothetical protein